MDVYSTASSYREAAELFLRERKKKDNTMDLSAFCW